MSTSGFVDKLFPEYKFLPYKDIVIEYSSKLKQKGANAVLIVSHVGNKCPQNKTYDVRTEKTPQEACFTDEITNLIDVLPENTIHGIVSGHRHRWVHHYYKGIPFMGSINGGYYFNVLYLNFNSETKEIVDSAIEGPIPVCEKLFANTLTCEYQNE